MQVAQQARPWHERITVSTRFGTLGGVRTSDLHSQIPAMYHGPVAQLLVAGTPISCSTNVGERLRHAAEAEWEEAVECLEGLDGPFAVVMWHEALRRLTIVTDILGMQPLYFHRHTGMLAWAILSSKCHAVSDDGKTGMPRPCSMAGSSRFANRRGFGEYPKRHMKPSHPSS
jgi:Glutamine amidotransferase domain